ncbi:MAG: tetratricopeptide repeat protein [Phycisphaerales bacterium JB063]
MFRKPLTYALLAACSTPLLLTGCSGTQQGNHEQWVDDADNKWTALKSDIAMEMAEQQFATGQLTLALKTVRDQLNMDPENPHLWLMAGRVALENSELERSFGYLGKAIEYDPELAEPYYYQGIIHQRWQQYDQALSRYTNAREQDPDNPSYTLAEAEMLAQLNRLDEAVAMLQEKATYFDQNAAIRAMLGHIHRRNNNHEQASFWFKQASMLAPDDHKLAEELARSYMTIGSYRQAANTLSQLLYTEYGQDRDDLRRMLAEAYVQNRQLREAKNVCLQLTRNDPTNVEDWFQLGELNYRLEDYASALQSANRLINLAPDDHRGYTLAGMVWNKRGRLDRALSMFDRAAEVAPHDTTPLILRGMALQRDERPEAAAEAYRQALEVDPDDHRAQRLLASVTEDLH